MQVENQKNQEQAMSITRKSLISNRGASKKAIVTKPEVNKISATKVAATKVGATKITLPKVTLNNTRVGVKMTNVTVN